MNSEIRHRLVGFVSDLAKIGVIVLLVLSILFFSTVTVNFFIHCEHATIFEYYNFCDGDREKAKALIEEMKM